MNAVIATILSAIPTPTPIPGYTGDVDLVTPGIVGFIATFVVAAGTVLLLIDMTRRVRRVRYRAEVRDSIARELGGDATEPADRSPR